MLLDNSFLLSDSLMNFRSFIMQQEFDSCNGSYGYVVTTRHVILSFEGFPPVPTCQRTGRKNLNADNPFPSALFVQSFTSLPSTFRNLNCLFLNTITEQLTTSL